MKSGHYIQLVKGDDLQVVADEFKVPVWKLKQENPDKAFKPGQWVFIPLKRGIAAHTHNHRTVASEADVTADTNYYLSQGEFAWPVPSSKNVSSNFGRRWGRKHEGIDIAARRGANIVAAAAGVVVYSGSEMGGYGNITVIAHDDGFFTVYAHADRNLTRKGQKVHQGQVIAKVGSTGRSTGNHLHFEIRHNSKAINPKKMLAHRH